MTVTDPELTLDHIYVQMEQHLTDAENLFDEIALEEIDVSLEFTPVIRANQIGRHSEGDKYSNDAGEYETVGYRASKMLRKGLAAGAKLLAVATKKLFEKMALVINKTGAYIKSFVGSGLPILLKRLKRLNKIKARVASNDSEMTDKDRVPVSGAKRFFTINSEILDKDEVIEKTVYLNEITNIVLGREKLSKFDSYASRILEPYRESIKSKRTDEIVFLMGVLATLTNPAVAVGAVLKKLFSVAAPNAGKAIDVGSSLAGLKISSVSVGHYRAVIPTLGSHSASILRDWSNGKMNLSSLPTYREMYGFCNKEIDNDKKSMYVVHACPVLFANMQWRVVDYKEIVGQEQRGTVKNLGARFVKANKQKGTSSKEMKEKFNMEPLTKDEALKILTELDELLNNAVGYCKNVGARVEAYEKQYKAITDIVMSYGENTLRDKYIRSSYKTAMNQVLGSIWTNSFGSDIRFIHYLIKLSNTLLEYCDHSIVGGNPDKKAEMKKRRVRRRRF